MYIGHIYGGKISGILARSSPTLDRLLFLRFVPLERRLIQFNVEKGSHQVNLQRSERKKFR